MLSDFKTYGALFGALRVALDEGRQRGKPYYGTPKFFEESALGVHEAFDAFARQHGVMPGEAGRLRTMVLDHGRNEPGMWFGALDDLARLPSAYNVRGVWTSCFESVTPAEASPEPAGPLQAMDDVPSPKQSAPLIQVVLESSCGALGVGPLRDDAVLCWSKKRERADDIRSDIRRAVVSHINPATGSASEVVQLSGAEWSELWGGGYSLAVAAEVQRGARLATALRDAIDGRLSLDRPIEPSAQPSVFTLVGIDERKGTILQVTQVAQDALQAFGRASADRSGQAIQWVTALCPDGTLDYPGEGPVAIETVLDQPDVFGLQEPNRESPGC